MIKNIDIFTPDKQDRRIMYMYLMGTVGPTSTVERIPIFDLEYFLQLQSNVLFFPLFHYHTFLSLHYLHEKIFTSHKR